MNNFCSEPELKVSGTYLVNDVFFLGFKAKKSPQKIISFKKILAFNFCYFLSLYQN